jgi:DNA-directed RNA polymerase subunit RPC12/RpoP
MTSTAQHYRPDSATAKHIIPCDECGTRYVVFPPTEEYKSTMYRPCPRVDYQKSFYDCTRCSQRNFFYWHKEHREDKIFRFDGSLEVESK